MKTEGSLWAMSEYLADLPLDDPAEDKFGRAPFAARVVGTVIGRTGSEPLVIGIYGPWGSGKTTVLNFIRAGLRESKEHVVVSFNPWLFSSTEQLLVEFFAAIARALDKRLSTPLEELGAFFKKLGGLASGLSTAVGSPVDPGALIGGVGGLLAGVDVDEMKDRVSKALRDESKHVVIFVDDIDRLDVEETYLLFRLIKLVADFDNTTYILAFDHRVVAAALNQRYPQEGRFGEGFIDKIVQVPLNLPPARLDLVHGLIFEGVDELFAREDVELATEDVIRFRRAFDLVGLDINTPRSAGKYLNALRFAIPMVKGEVDTVDLLALEAIRATSLALYLWLSASKRLLTEPSIGGSTSDQEKAELEEGFAVLSTSLAARMRSVVSSLFPKAAQLLSPFHIGGSGEEELAKAKRIASPAYFDRYFIYTVLSDDVAETEIDRLLALANAGDPELPEALRRLVSSPRVEPLLAKLRQRSGDMLSTGIEHLVTALAAIGPELDFSWRGVFSMSTGEQAALLVHDLIQQLPDLKTRCALAEAFVRAAEPLELAVDAYRWIAASTDD